jgi:hypothetical protein
MFGATFTPGALKIIRNKGYFVRFTYIRAKQ